jgi:hypothetical protein
MKTSTLLSIALSILGISWLMLAGSSRYTKNESEKVEVADFFITVVDEDGAPLRDYLARIDGKLAGRTNAAGMVSKSALGIGNLPTVVMTLQSTLNRYEKKREILFTLPEQPNTRERPVYSIAVALCIDFLACEDDSFRIDAGRKTPQVLARGKIKKALQSEDSYEFSVHAAGDGSRKTAAVIRELRKQLEKHKPGSSPVPVELKLSQTAGEKSERMIRVTGKRKNSGSVDHEFAFLLPTADDPADLAKSIFGYLAEARPGQHVPQGRRLVRMTFPQGLSDSYEVYAGGIKGEIVNIGSWNLAVPASGRFFLTVYNKGKVISRKFFDARDAEHLDFGK